MSAPCPGECYADMDPRMSGRTFRVDRVEYSPRMGHDVAVCVILTDKPGAVRSRVGQITRIAVGRFTPTNYKLIEGEAWGSPATASDTRAHRSATMGAGWSAST